MRAVFLWGYRFSQGLVIFLCGVLLVLSSTAIAEYGKNYDRTSAKALTLLLATGLVMLFVCLYGKISDKCHKLSQILFLGILGMQVFFLVMVSCPMSIGDPSRVQSEALAMLKLNQGQMDEQNQYFQSYPNNHFIVILFYYFYKILGSMGITEIWIPSIILNVFCIDIGIYFTYAAVKKIKSVTAANMVLFFFLICPNTYLWLTSVYTNTISFPFIMGILFLGLDMESVKLPGILKYVLLGILMVVGYFIRPTTIIPIIALVLYHGVCFFQRRGEGGIQGDSVKIKRIKEVSVRFLLLFFVCGLTWFSCKKLIYRHVDANKFTENFPIEHWIMMGMNQETGGGFSREDRIFTSSLSGIEGKRQGARDRLKQRIQHMGISGVAQLFMEKLTRVWAMGDDEGIPCSRYAYRYPPLYRYFIGQYNTWFVFYMQALRIVMFLLIGIGLVKQLCYRQATPLFLYALTLLGAICFFLIWEAGKRYNICFNGICLLLMVDGVETIREWLRGAVPRVTSITDSIVGERRDWAYGIIKAGISVGTICLIVGSLLCSNHYAKKPKVIKDMYYCSRMGVDAQPINWIGISRPDLLEQTIQEGQMEWRNKWKRLKIYFTNTNPRIEKGEYRVEVISMDNNQVIYRSEIAPKDVMKKGEVVIHIKGKKPSLTGYKIRLTHLGEGYHLIPMVCKFPLLDPYPNGFLSVNGKRTDWDLSMSIYNAQKK